jgi:hypothetical protein
VKIKCEKKKIILKNVGLSKLDFLNVLESAWRNSARSEVLTAIHYKDCCLLVSVTCMHSAVPQKLAATIIVVKESIKKKIDTSNFHLEKF